MKANRILAAILLTLAASGAQANLVVNGSFEKTPPLNGNVGSFTSITGWTATPELEVQNYGTISYNPYAGSQYVELDAVVNGAMYQDLATTGGQAYTLSFAYSPRPGNTTPTSNQIDVFWDTQLVARLDGDPKNAAWSLKSFTVNAVGAKTLLTFQAAGTSESLGGFIDDVVVTAVPEPETYAMLLAGLGLMSAIARRRRQ